MGNSTSVDGGNDDPDRAWRRPAPGEEPEDLGAASPSDWLPGGTQDPQRAIWGPEADSSRQPPISMTAAPPPVWEPPASAFSGRGAAPPAAPRWEPVAGRPGADQEWGGPSGPAHVGVDERPAPPPRQPATERFTGWWARAGIAAAVLAVVIAVIAVASGSDPGGEASTATSTPPTSIPPTTVRRTTTTTAPAATTSAAPTSTTGSPAEVDPASLDPEDDPRVMLTDLPDSYTAVNAQLVLEGFQGGRMTGLLFVADGSTWADGPWVRISPAAETSFIGPAVPVDVAGRPGRLGTSEHGAELVAFDVEGDDAVAVSANGLEAGTAVTVAAALAIGPDATWSVPAGALPPGLRLASGDLAESLTGRPASSAVVNYRGPGGVGLTVYASLARPGYDPLSVAPFYLTDLSYVTVGSEQGLMGVYHYDRGTIARSVQWRHAGIDIEMTSFGMETQELLELAAHASTRADSGWTERQWSAAEDAVLDLTDSATVLVEQVLEFGDEGGGTVMATRYGQALSWWLDASTGLSVGRYGQEAGPVLLQVGTNAVPAIQTDGASYVLALALGDESIAGATLRVRTGVAVTGGDGIGHESGAIVHSLADADDDAAGAPSEFGYALGAAVAVPWPEGEFVAELVAADGVTILATATAADLR